MASCLVYKYSCGSCQATYIGKTVRHMAKRMEEHGSDRKSSIYSHAEESGHDFNVENFQVLARGRSDIDISVKESLLIKECNPDLNRNIPYRPLLLF